MPDQPTDPVPLAHTVKEAAALLRVSESHLYREIRAGSVPRKKIGRRWLIPASALRAWLDGGER